MNLKGKCIRIFTILLLLVSLAVNAIFILSDVYLNLQIKRIDGLRFQTSNEQKIIDGKKIADESYNWIKDGWKHFLPKHIGSPIENLKFNLYGIESVTSYRPYLSSEELWLQLAILENAQIRGDHEKVKSMKLLFDQKINKVPIEQISQSQIGMLAIEYFKIYNDLCYKQKAKEVYNYLCNRINGNKGVTVSDDLVEVDENGMSVPFLVEYSKVFADSTAYHTAIQQIEYYLQNGTDYTTGFPYHAIRLKEPVMPIGESNWGRGFGWWTIGLNSININDLTLPSRLVVSKLNENLVKVWNTDNGFGTLVRQSSDIDMSATMPILYYLCKQELIECNDKLVSNLSIYLHDGLFYNCSGPKDGLTISKLYQPNPLAQAFYIKLINYNMQHERNY